MVKAKKKDTASSKILADKPRSKQRSEEYLKYKRYIASKEFDRVRQACFDRDGHRCACCGWGPDDYVDELKSTHRSLSCHHKSYVHLYHELEHMEDVVTLCNICHRATHSAPSNMHWYRKPK